MYNKHDKPFSWQKNSMVENLHDKNDCHLPVTITCRKEIWDNMRDPSSHLVTISYIFNCTLFFLVLTCYWSGNQTYWTSTTCLPFEAWHAWIRVETQYRYQTLDDNFTYIYFLTYLSTIFFLHVSRSHMLSNKGELSHSLRA